jgi:hypothetical protein
MPLFLNQEQKTMHIYVVKFTQRQCYVFVFPENLTPRRDSNQRSSGPQSNTKPLRQNIFV